MEKGLHIDDKGWFEHDAACPVGEIVEGATLESSAPAGQKYFQSLKQNLQLFWRRGDHSQPECFIFRWE